jgi:hypothetical protein
MLVLSHLLMIYVTWLMLDGSWTQTLINIDVAARHRLFHGSVLRCRRRLRHLRLGDLLYNLYLVATARLQSRSGHGPRFRGDGELEEMIEHHGQPQALTATAAKK